MPAPEGLARLLEAVEAAAPVDAVSAVTEDVGRRLDATSVSLLVVDNARRALTRLVHTPLQSHVVPGSPGRAGRTDGEESARLLPFDGGPIEGVVRGQRHATLPPDRSVARLDWTVLAPVTQRGEVIGVLELELPDEPSAADTEEIASLAHLLAYVIIANQRHTDLFEWGHRNRPLSLSAEIQQRLLPGALTCEAAAFTLAGWLEPAADIAGDTFDYSLARDSLFLSMTDAMGHGVNAALTATLCVGALRGSRRAGGSMIEQAAAANAAVGEHADRNAADDFVTGLLGRIDLRTGTLDLINAGHVAPYLARAGEVRALALPANLPFGMFPDAEYETTAFRLEAGDRLMFLTDGMTERDATAVDIPAAIRATAPQHPREALAALVDDVLTATGHALSDDATALCVDWHGGHGRPRYTDGGADLIRGTARRARRMGPGSGAPGARGRT